MALAKKKASGGAPEWALTYGDMMSLLLCFFILLSAFADYEKGGGGTAAVMAAVQSIQAALGMPAVAPSKGAANAIQFNSMLEQIKVAIQKLNAKTRNNTEDKGVQGKNFRLRRIRDGMEITIGGPIMFEPFSKQPTSEGTESLADVGNIVKGHRNKLDVIGHAADQPAPTDWTDSDALQLSYERARVVGEALVKMGVDPRAIRLIAAGAHEPVPASDEMRSLNVADYNRRVEIIVRESLLDDYQSEKPAQGVPLSTQAQTRPAAQTTP